MATTFSRCRQTSSTGYGLIDNLNLTYNGNQLQAVKDIATSAVYGNGIEFKDGTNQTTEYTYDKNGNLIKDLNKNLSNIQYNLLNLPSQVILAGSNSIDYEYGADGTKLRTVHKTGSTNLTTDYCGNAIYENGGIKTKKLSIIHGLTMRRMKNEERYTYIGGKGSVLGEFESIIDKLLTDGFDVGSLYSDGFTFDIVENDKGALLGSKERDWDFLDEFANGVGPEFSIFLSDHPYTMAMMNDKSVLEAHQRIVDGITDIPGQITEWPGNWNLWDAFTTVSIAKQFIGSYRFDAFTSKDGKSLNNVISDSKSMSSFLYHMWPSSWNQRRSSQKPMGNTYQFYIWKTLKMIE